MFYVCRLFFKMQALNVNYFNLCIVLSTPIKTFLRDRCCFVQMRESYAAEDFLLVSVSEAVSSFLNKKNLAHVGVAELL